ncbi:MAG: hypothetical protein LAP40_27155 [Acidobacteriia bacterium]|nr:hypothetical protein [Terriglobia bacterium]
MKRLVRVIARLYPKSWRDRYGVEFDALLDDAGADARTAADVLAGALLMQIRTWKWIASATMLAVTVFSALAWQAGRRTYESPGANLILHSDSGLGAMLGFFSVVLATLMLFAAGALCLGGKCRAAGKVAGTALSGLAIYALAVGAVSLLTPRTIVSIGDSYCFDNWCIGVQNVTATPQGQSVLYQAHVRIFSDTDLGAATARGAAIYLLDEQGRRFPLLADPLATPFDVNLQPRQSVTTSLTFRAAADARHLFLTGDGPSIGLPALWVSLYLGSDTSLFHRRTLLRVR